MEKITPRTALAKRIGSSYTLIPDVICFPVDSEELHPPIGIQHSSAELLSVDRTPRITLLRMEALALEIGEVAWLTH